KYPDQSVRILVQGLKRIEIADYTQREPYFRADVRHLQDVLRPSKDLDAVQAHMVNQFAKFVSMIPYLPDELQVVVMNIKDPDRKYPDQSVRILVQGLKRIEIADYTQREPYFRADVRHLQDVLRPSKDLDAVQAHMVNQFAKFVSMIPYLPDELQVVVMNIKD